MIGEPLLTVSEVAARLRISKNLAYTLCANGAIPSVRLAGGRVIRIRPEALARFLQAQEISADERRS